MPPAMLSASVCIHVCPGQGCLCARVSTLNGKCVFSEGERLLFPYLEYLALTPITALSWSQPHFTMQCMSEHHLPNTIKVSYDHSIGGARRAGWSVCINEKLNIKRGSRRMHLLGTVNRTVLLGINCTDTHLCICGPFVCRTEWREAKGL